MIKSYNFLFFFSLFFLIYKIVAIYLTNFDLFGDEAQYWLWSKDLDYGYYSKPPLLAWTIAVFSFFLGSDFFALKMIPVFLYCPVVLVVFIITKKLYEDRFFAFIVSITFFFSARCFFIFFFNFYRHTFTIFLVFIANDGFIY